MLTSNNTISAQASPQKVMAHTAENGFAAAVRSQFIAFFQQKGFTCAADALQQLKATYKKLTVRLSVSDAKIASDQGHAVCYLSFAPNNRQYKIAIGNIPQAQTENQFYTYTLLEDTFAKTGSFRQTNITFHSLEELLNAILPKAISFKGVGALQSLFSFLF